MRSIDLTRSLARSCAAFALVLPALAFAQTTEGSAQASGTGDIELGATQPSQVEMNASSRRRADPPPSHRSGELRFGMQLRLNALNMLNFTRPAVGGGGVGTDWQLLVPLATPGVRLLDERLFLGLGLGLSGVTVTAGNGADNSRSGWSLSPLATYDIVSDQVAALSLIGWLNFARLSNSEACAPNGTCMTGNDHIFGWGAAIGAGVRGFVSQGLSLGGEFGWSFLKGDGVGENGFFLHGLFGNIFLEGSIAL